MAYKFIPMGEFSPESKAQLIAGLVMLAMKAKEAKPELELVKKQDQKQLTTSQLKDKNHGSTQH